ncbi:hypothetical protein B484DRAFT_453272 [Ochromonadaceae sp. CCMP2298]|nr:hypothetical protein B484DRAFT_453272 [Ochromonadaceae sp. CCMP2298]
MAKLFDSPHFNIMAAESHLKSLADCMLASLLQYLEPFLQGYGSQHIVLRALFDTAKEFNIPREKLLGWGQLVRADYTRRNALNTVGRVGELSGVIKGLHQELLSVRDENAELRRTMARAEKLRSEEAAAVRTSIDSLDMQLKQIAGFMRCMSMRPMEEAAEEQSPSKRQREDAINLTQSFYSQPDVDTPPLIATPVQPDAFALLKAGGAKQETSAYSILGSLAIEDLFGFWFRKGFTLTDTSLTKWTAGTKQAKARLKVVLLRADELLETRRPILHALLQPEPPTTSEGWTDWRARNRAAGIALRDAVQASITDKVKSQTYSITAISGRLTATAVLATPAVVVRVPRDKGDGF